jgi:hypothetical protein
VLHNTYSHTDITVSTDNVSKDTTVGNTDVKST